MKLSNGITSINSIRPVSQLAPRWTRALQNVRTGAGDAKVVFFGDSTFFGRGSNGTGTGNLIPNSLPTQFATKLATRTGLTCNAHGWFGNGGSPNTFSTNDTRVTFGAGWASGGSTTLGGATINNSTTTNALSFLPTSNVDTFIVYNTRFSGNGTLSLDINGGTATNINQNGSTAIIASTITGTLGSSTLNVKRVSGAVGFQGMEAFDSTKKQVRVINGGWSGGTSADFSVTTQPWCPGNTALWTAINADLVFVEAGINEWNFNAVTTAQYKTNLQTIVTNVRAAGSDVIFVTPVPSDTAYASASVAKQQSYIAVMMTVAAENKVFVIDIFGRFVDYTTSSGRYWDGAHPNGTGYSDEADMILSVLLS
jgi:lysophospholipase L1-like esterase